MLTAGGVALPSAAEVLEQLELAGLPERPFPNDGWSGASLTVVERGGDRFVLKRDSPARDWIARATLDGPLLREAWFAAAGPPLPGPIARPYLGVGRDGEEFLLVTPDLTGILIEWEAPVDEATLDGVLDALARLHRAPPSAAAGDEPDRAPWCPLPERLLLTSRPFATRYLAQGGAAATSGARLLAGWEAFERHAPVEARRLVHDLVTDIRPLVTALESEPAALLHGDLKLANVGIAGDGSVPAVDWQMVMLGPVALELGWFLVSNSASLPLPPDIVLERYRALAPLAERSTDLAWICGLLLRGWRKGLDAEARAPLASGLPGSDDLAAWCRNALDAAARVL
ncbi:MAG TPA: phosphotransferase [Candidatus Limnocylindrales bacterium]